MNIAHHYLDMKSFMDFGVCTRLKATFGRKLPFALTMAAALLAAGCGKKETPATNTSSGARNPAASNAEPAIAPLTPVLSQTNPIVVPAADSDLSVVQQLNRAAIGFRMEKHRYPTTVEEVAAFAGIQMPTPPAGKKYILNRRGLVVLVDNPAP